MPDIDATFHYPLKTDSLADTKGQVGVFDGSYWKILSVDTDGKVFTADSTSSTGIKWVGLGTSAFTTITIATNYTTTVSDYIIGVTNTASVRTITLATATVITGKVFIIKDQSGGAGTNNIVIATEGAELIDGHATATITGNYKSLTLYSDGSNWFTI